MHPAALLCVWLCLSNSWPLLCDFWSDRCFFFQLLRFKSLKTFRCTRRRWGGTRWGWLDHLLGLLIYVWLTPPPSFFYNCLFFLPYSVLSPCQSFPLRPLFSSLFLSRVSLWIWLCLCFPSGLCSWVCPITLISLIYTWTSAAVRYALALCAAPGTLAHLLHRLMLVAAPSCPTPLCLPPVEVSRRRRDSGAVSSGFLRGDFRHLR